VKLSKAIGSEALAGAVCAFLKLWNQGAARWGA